jgi:hypothetical protein
MPPKRELKRVATYKGHVEAILSLAISTDGRLMASGGKHTYHF